MLILSVNFRPRKHADALVTILPNPLSVFPLINTEMTTVSRQ